MFSKLNFLGVANATSAKAVAGVATSAKKTGAVKKFTALTAMALVAFGLSGCDDVKSLAASVEEPLVRMEFNNRGKPYLVIQSQDNETSINSVKLNRGNCGVELYRATQEKEVVLAYARANKDKVLFSGERTAYIKFVYNGQLHKFDNFSAYVSFGKDGLSAYASGSLYTNDLPVYNTLDEASKALFVPVYPVKLPYGEKFSPKINCDASKIIEVELNVNGATFTYNFEQGGF